MDIMWRAWGEVSEANLFLIAGGVTYAILLVLFPGLAALVSLYGLVLDASQIEKQVGTLSEILPAETQQLLVEQLHKLVEASSGALGIGAAVGVVLALWSASRGMSGLITALNIAYEEKERRGRTGVARAPLRRGEKLQAKIEAQLSAIKRMPQLIRSFFKAPSVSYITDW